MIEMQVTFPSHISLHMSIGSNPPYKSNGTWIRLSIWFECVGLGFIAALKALFDLPYFWREASSSIGESQGKRALSLGEQLFGW